MLCACILYFYAKCFTENPSWHQFVKNHIVDEHPKGPWGYRPDDPTDWNVDWGNYGIKEDVEDNEN